VRGWLEHSGGVVAEAGRALMARRRGEGGLGGGCAGEGWARGTKLTGGPWLPARGSGARGRGRGADGRGPDVSERERCAELGRLGRGERRGARAREAGWAGFGPAGGGGSFLFLFLFLIPFFSFFYFCFFLFLFPLRPKIFSK
jgi:hypothetical protein